MKDTSTFVVAHDHLGNKGRYMIRRDWSGALHFARLRSERNGSYVARWRVIRFKDRSVTLEIWTEGKQAQYNRSIPGAVAAHLTKAAFHRMEAAICAMTQEETAEHIALSRAAHAAAVTARNPDPIPGESFLRSFHAWRLQRKEEDGRDPLTGNPFTVFKLWLHYNAEGEAENAPHYWEHYNSIFRKPPTLAEV